VVVLCSAASAQLGTTGVGEGGFGSSAAYTGPGNITGSAYAWYGLRAYTTATAGTKAANICNSGDANCADVNTLANGSFDVATAQGAPLNCGGAGGTCTIKTLYDKSGNTRDIANATIANRPTLVFNAFGTKAAMSCNGNSELHTAATVNISQPFTSSVVANTTAVGNIWSDSNNANLFTNNTSTSMQLVEAAAFTLTTAFSTSYSLQTLSNGASSKVRGNATTVTGDIGASGTFNGTMSICANSAGGGSGVTGIFGEFGFWTGDQSANWASMESNQRSYWGF